MPEGPTIIMMKEEMSAIKGKTIVNVSGYAKLDYERLKNKKVMDLKTWGKRLFIVLKDVIIDVHLGLFGSYLLNEKKPGINAKLQLVFTNDVVNFYVVNVKLRDDLENIDWSSDVMGNQWSAGKAKMKLKEIPGKYLCDALLEQDIFGGVGNVIKNEVMWLAKLHPLTKIEDLSVTEINRIMAEVVRFPREFLKYRRSGTLNKHLHVYKKEVCSQCGSKIKAENSGRSKRRNYWCISEQVPDNKLQNASRRKSKAQGKAWLKN